MCLKSAKLWIGSRAPINFTCMLILVWWPVDVIWRCSFCLLRLLNWWQPNQPLINLFAKLILSETSYLLWVDWVVLFRYTSRSPLTLFTLFTCRLVVEIHCIKRHLGHALAYNETLSSKKSYLALSALPNRYSPCTYHKRSAGQVVWIGKHNDSSAPYLFLKWLFPVKKDKSKSVIHNISRTVFIWLFINHACAWKE